MLRRGRHFSSLRKSQTGHQQIGLVVWIWLIIGVIAGSKYYEYLTGQTIWALLDEVPVLWVQFVRWNIVALVLGVCTVAILIRHSTKKKGSLIIERGSEGTRVRRNSAAPVWSGVLVAGFGVLWAVFGFIGSGWSWIVVIIIGALGFLIGIAFLFVDEIWMLKPREIVSPKGKSGVEGVQWGDNEKIRIEMKSDTRGGLGRPLIERFRVLANDVPLLITEDGELATKFLEILREEYE